MKMWLERAREKLEKHSQEHLLRMYDFMPSRKQIQLLEQIDEIDFDLMDELYAKALAPVTQEDVVIEPADYIDKDKINPAEAARFEQLGTSSIKNGELAVVTMAGGQGTRLGHNGPKGTFVFDKENNTTIFEALCETLKEANQKYGVIIRWYLMTSRENNDETVKFFEEKDYFGYPKDSIIFFKQGELPMLNREGKILLNRDGMIKLAANGHGGTLFSMKKAGIIDDMKARGIKWVFINGVDNVLVKPVDPLFMGMAIDKGVYGAIKSVAKEYPEEKVGVLCKKNGKVGVLEYTEISNDMANLRTEDGTLIYGDANAIFNLFSIEGLERVAEIKLPYHVAFKKADYLGQDGRIVVAQEPNSYKFEMFIFDGFEMFDKVVVLRVKRSQEFAPIKNKSGVDSPETALAMYKEYRASIGKK